MPYAMQAITSKQAQEYHNEFQRVGIYNPLRPSDYNQARATFILQELNKGFRTRAQQLANAQQESLKQRIPSAAAVQLPTTTHIPRVSTLGQNRLQQLSQTNSQLQSQLQAERERAIKLQQQAQAFNQQNQQLVNKATEQSQFTNQLQQQLGLTQEQNKQLQVQSAQLQLQAQQKEQQLAQQYQAQLQQALNKQNLSLQQESTKQLLKYQQNIEGQYQNKLGQLSKQAQSLQQQLLKQQQAEKQTIQQLKNELAQSQLQSQQIQKVFTNRLTNYQKNKELKHQDQIKLLRQQIDQLQPHLQRAQSLQKELDALKTHQQQAESLTIQQLRGQLDQEKKQYTQAIQKSDLELSSLKQTLEQQQRSKLQLQEQIKELQSQFAEQQKNAQIKHQENLSNIKSSAQQSAQQQIADVKKQFEEQLQSLQQSNQNQALERKQQLKNLLSEGEKNHNQKLLEQKAQHEKQLQNQLEQEQAKLNQQKKEIQALNNATEKLKKDLEARLKIPQEEIKDLTTEILKIKKQLDEKNQSIEQIKKQLDAENESALNKQREEHIKKLNMRNEQLVQKENDNNKLRDELVNKTKELESLKTHQQQAESNAIQELQNQLEQEKITHQKQLALQEKQHNATLKQQQEQNSQATKALQLQLKNELPKTHPKENNAALQLIQDELTKQTLKNERLEKSLNTMNQIIEENKQLKQQIEVLKQQKPLQKTPSTNEDARFIELNKQLEKIERENRKLKSQLQSLQQKYNERDDTRKQQRIVIDNQQIKELKSNATRQTKTSDTAGKQKSTQSSRLQNATTTAVHLMAKQRLTPQRTDTAKTWQDVSIYLFNNTNKSLSVNVPDPKKTEISTQYIIKQEKSITQSQPLKIKAGQIKSQNITFITDKEIPVDKQKIIQAAKKAAGKTNAIVIQINKIAGSLFSSDTYPYEVNVYKPHKSTHAASSTSAQQKTFTIAPNTTFRFGDTSYSFTNPNIPAFAGKEAQLKAAPAINTKQILNANEAKSVKELIDEFKLIEEREEEAQQSILQSRILHSNEIDRRVEAHKKGIADEGWCGQEYMDNGTILLYTIHGTWSENIAFGGDIFSITTYNTFRFACQLAQQEKLRVKIVSVTWSGSLSPEHRLLQAEALAEECIRVYKNQNNKIRKIWMIAHSHGCNVAAMAANRLWDNSKILPDVGIFMSSPALQEPRHEGLNFKTVYAFYSQADFTQMAGSIEMGLTGRPLKGWTWGTLWTQLKKKINTERKMPLPKVADRKVYNIRTMLNGLDRDHINIKWAVMPFLAQIIDIIQQYYPDYYDLELNVEDTVDASGNPLYEPMIAIRKKNGKADPKYRTHIDARSEKKDQVAREAFNTIHKSDISSMGRVYTQGLTWLWNFLREVSTLVTTPEPKINKDSLKIVERHGSGQSPSHQGSSSSSNN